MFWACDFSSRSDCLTSILFRRALSPALPQKTRFSANSWLDAARIFWTGHANWPGVILFVGRERFLSHRPATGRRRSTSMSSAGNGCGDYRSRRSARDQPRAHPVASSQLTMTSEDVIHSFIVPAFRTKQGSGARRRFCGHCRGHQAGKSFRLFAPNIVARSMPKMVGN